MSGWSSRCRKIASGLSSIPLPKKDSYRTVRSCTGVVAPARVAAGQDLLAQRPRTGADRCLPPQRADGLVADHVVGSLLVR